jgi:MFS family permease
VNALKSKNYKWEVLALLWIAFFLNQADRQIFNVLLSPIRDDLDLTDPQMGMIASILILTLALGFPIAGVIGDLFSRKWICTLTIIFWSAATMVTGMSTTVLHLILFRSIATGGGEALYAPANYALIADYHKNTRSQAMAIHTTALYIGVIVSGFAATAVAEIWGWRAAFYVFGSAGIVVGIIMAFRLKDAPAMVQEQSGRIRDRLNLKKSLRILFQKKTALGVTIGLVCQVFVNIAYLTWMPTFLYEKFDMSLVKAGFTSMCFMYGFAFLGILISGRLSDRLALKRRRWLIEIQAIGMLLGAPFLMLAGFAPTQLLTFIAIAGFGLFRGVYDANIYTSLYTVVVPKLRASASGMMLLIAFSAGAVAPYLLGVLKVSVGLSLTIAWMSALNIIAAICLFIVVKYFFDKDQIEPELA